MLVETDKAFVGPAAMMTQMRDDSNFWSLPPLTILRWRTPLVITKHTEDGPGMAQMDITTRLITFLVMKRFRSGVNIARTRSF